MDFLLHAAPQVPHKSMMLELQKMHTSLDSTKTLACMISITGFTTNYFQSNSALLSNLFHQSGIGTLPDQPKVTMSIITTNTFSTDTTVVDASEIMRKPSFQKGTKNPTI